MNSAAATANPAHNRPCALNPIGRTGGCAHAIRRQGSFRLCVLLAGGLLAGCGPQTPDPPAAPVENADAVMAADLNGDGNQELIALHGGHLHWLGRKEPFDAGLAAHTVADIDADGRDELIVATRGRRGPKSKNPAILVVDEDGITPHPLARNDRFRIAGLSALDDRVFASILGPKKVATGGWWTPEGFTPVTESQMGLVQEPLPNGTVAVGRIYGDAPRSDGQLELHLSDGSIRVLPGYRGIRSLAAADLNRDGHLDLLSADGWHFQYGEHATARLNVYFGPDYTDHRLVGTIDGDYTINRIEVASGTPATVVASGTSKVVTFTPDPMGWTPITIGNTREGGTAALVQGPNHPYIALPGEPIVVVPVTPQ
ncbi:MAG: VCBS repeat-containing protein [Myxococcota bacterium]|nr:VCBS repeat-containing protein [Myxococcota bacterium]